MKLIPLILFLAGVSNLGAFEVGDRLDIKLLDGSVVGNAKVTAIEKNRIIAINKDGVHTITKDSLEKAQQDSIGWSPEASKAHSDSEAKISRENDLKKQRDERIAELENKILLVTIVAAVEMLQVLDDGFLCKSGSGVYGPERQRKIPARHVDEEMVYCETLPGLDGPRTYTKVDRFKKLVSPEKIEKYRETYYFDSLFFIEAPTDGYVDGSIWSGRIWENGTYVYTNTAGARKTVKRYTAYMPDSIRAIENEIKKIKEPNKAVEPTTMRVTDPANATNPMGSGTNPMGSGRCLWINS